MNTYVEENKVSVGMPHFSFCWKAVLAGVVTALSIQIALTVLGTAIGMTTVNPMTQYNPVAGLAKFGAYWWIVSGLISLAVGSLVAGYLSKTDSLHEGETVGLVTWSVINVIGALAILCTAGRTIEVGGRILGGTLSTVIRASSAAAPTLADKIKQYLPDGMKEINTTQARSELDLLIKSNSKADQGLTEAFDRTFNKDSGVENPINKEALANIIASRSNISREQAMESINKWQAAYSDAKVKFEAAKAEAEQKARAAAEKVAQATRTGALVVFFTLLLGLATSVFSARLGVYYRNPEVKICWR